MIAAALFFDVLCIERKKKNLSEQMSSADVRERCDLGRNKSGRLG